MTSTITPTVTTGALPASTKVFKPGTIHTDIRVPMREISVHPSAGEPPVVVYDSSGPYTDPAAGIAISAGCRVCAKAGSRPAATPRRMMAAVYSRRTTASSLSTG